MPKQLRMYRNAIISAVQGGGITIYRTGEKRHYPEAALTKASLGRLARLVKTGTWVVGVHADPPSVTHVYAGSTDRVY